jgi:alkanesulfonate monooxygenase SsuD/methylene tetrahydromethanopterin reductase-like flavin-dependent oxidoreductase (luciferase family)
VTATSRTPEILLDELTLWGDAAAARAALERLYAAGADMPIITLPPNRNVQDLDHILDALAPAVAPRA